MSKTIEGRTSSLIQKMKIAILKRKIRTMQKASYLNLYQRMELRDILSLLQNPEMQKEMEKRNLISLL